MNVAGQIDTAKKLIAALKSGSDVAALLTSDVAFQALNVDLKSRDAVLKRIAESGQMFRDTTWDAPADKGGTVQIDGRTASAAKLTLTLHVTDGQVGLI